MARGMVISASLAALAAFVVATASLAADKPPDDSVRALRLTTKVAKIGKKAPPIGINGFHVPDESEEVCFPEQKVVCSLLRGVVVGGTSLTPESDARVDAMKCKLAEEVARWPKSGPPADGEFVAEEIRVPGPLARKVFALAELNTLRDEMTHDIAKQAVDAGVLHLLK